MFLICYNISEQILDLTRQSTGGAHCTASLKKGSRREGGCAGDSSAKNGSAQHSFRKLTGFFPSKRFLCQYL